MNVLKIGDMQKITDKLLPSGSLKFHVIILRNNATPPYLSFKNATLTIFLTVPRFARFARFARF